MKEAIKMDIILTTSKKSLTNLKLNFEQYIAPLIISN